MNPPVLMYTSATCPYCQRAERLLAAKGIADIARFRVDLDPQLRSQMTQKTGRRTVPQIYIGEHHVGGYEELAALDHAGKLEALLRGEPA
jgi:glutaredoxin 3